MKPLYTFLRRWLDRVDPQPEDLNPFTVQQALDQLGVELLTCPAPERLRSRVCGIRLDTAVSDRVHAVTLRSRRVMTVDETRAVVGACSAAALVQQALALGLEVEVT